MSRQCSINRQSRKVRLTYAYFVSTLPCACLIHKTYSSNTRITHNHTSSLKSA